MNIYQTVLGVSHGLLCHGNAHTPTVLQTSVSVQYLYIGSDIYYHVFRLGHTVQKSNVCPP